MNTYIKINDKIHLTEIRETDKPQFIKYLNNEKIFNNTLMIPLPYLEENADWYINHNQDLEAKNGFVCNWAIRTEGGDMMGVIGRLLGNLYGGNHKDEIGYWIGEPFWGQGIMSAVLRGFADYQFNNSDLIRIEAHVYAPNIGSQKALEKAGFTREGYCRKYYIKPADGLARDAVLYAKIKGD
jgi:ribosomal-protein-alanine N-acetyltransferase